MFGRKDYEEAPEAGQTITVLSDEDFAAATAVAELSEVEELPEDEIEELPEAPKETPKVVVKKSTRPPVPEGYITPVAFAKQLSEYYTRTKREAGLLAENEEVVVAPQYVYSTINAGRKPNAKNPLPTYSEGGRNNLLKFDEAMKWFQAKDERLVARARKASTVKKSETPIVEVTEEEAADVD